jgi:acyl-CoA synthetase (AMP-forming)/AMP-acid ligase II
LNLAVLLLGRARARPEAPALTGEGRTLSWGELAARARALAGGMWARGIAPGARVVLCMENRAEAVEALLAAWCAGLCAVPVNARLHPREVEHIAQACGAALVVTTPGLADALARLPNVVVAPGEGWDALLRADPVGPCPAEPGDPAWIFYTSGTTGRPKGAVLSHRNLLFMAHAYYADVAWVAPGETMLHAAPLSHGAGLFMLPHMLRGGHQVVLPGFDPERVVETVNAHRATSFFAAPTMLARLVAHPAADRLDARRLGTISYGGGPMYAADLERALDRLGPCLFQLYGQGEAPMTITGLGRAEHAGPGWQERIRTAGAARTGCAVRVVDEAGRDVAPGETGEIVTRSDCVMAGYLGDGPATARALRDGWLWTGDLGSLDARGALTLRDRSKDLVISGGSNVYPREVEEVLLRHPDVAEAAVVGRLHPDWGEEVVAFIVPRDGAAVDPAALDALCLGAIARFKRPRAYRVLEALPKSHYGKVLKTELRARLAGETA